MIARTESNRVSSESLHTSAEIALHRGDTKRAKRLLRRCVLRNRTDYRAWEIFGEAHYQRKNFPLAFAAFQRAERQGKLATTNQLKLALTCARLGRLEDASTRLSLLAQNDQLTSSQLLDVAMGLNSIGRVEQALHACRCALQIDPDNAQASYDLGYYCDLAGYPPTTTESLMRRAMKLEPSAPRYRIGLACLLARQNKLPQAFLVVRDVGGTSLSAMTCSDCIERLITIYRHGRDDRRLTICHQRLVELRLRGCGFSC